MYAYVRVIVTMHVDLQILHYSSQSFLYIDYLHYATKCIKNDWNDGTHYYNVFDKSFEKL